jgi:hypothetical protein
MNVNNLIQNVTVLMTRSYEPHSICWWCPVSSNSIFVINSIR